jgi:F-type H+-transporting ATPase subunit alpha
MESDLFAAGIRPAINAGLSVSRVGGAAQTKAMRQVAGGMRLDLAQYRNLAAFAQFGTSDLDAVTRRQLERGQRLTEILKQPQFSPLTLGQEVSIIFAGVNGFVDDVEPAQVRAFEEQFHKYMSSNHPDLLKGIEDKQTIDDDLDGKLRSAIEAFKQTVAL